MSCGCFIDLRDQNEALKLRIVFVAWGESAPSIYCYGYGVNKAGGVVSEPHWGCRCKLKQNFWCHWQFTGSLAKIVLLCPFAVFFLRLLTFIINEKRPSILPFTERTFPFVTEREKSMGQFFLSWHSSTNQYFFSEFRICDDWFTHLMTKQASTV